MDDNKCGCENDKLNEEAKEKPEEEDKCCCDVDESPVQTQDGTEDDDCGCRCEESTVNSRYASQEVKDCGCEIIEDDGCGCGTIEYPDTSTVNNPTHPKVIADDDFFKEFENYAHSLGFKSIGYTLLAPDLLIKDKFMQYTNTIVLTIEMDKEILETSPGEEAQRLNDLAYEKTGDLTYKLSDYLRKKGYATEIAHPYEGTVRFSALGQKAGLGFIGNSGLLMTPELGPQLKISAVTVSIANLPVKNDNEHKWVPDYCEKCGKCIKACPHEALIEKETCCGDKEIELIKKNCIGCSQGCTYCIEACPFYQEGYGHVKNKLDKMNAKLRENKNKKFKVEIWDNWARQNSALFKELIDGSSIAIAMTENKEKLIFLKKENDNLNAVLKDFDELENSSADLIFIIDKKDTEKILNSDDTSKFTELISSGQIEVYGLKDQLQLNNKGYTAFLNKLGLNIGGGCCCG